MATFVVSGCITAAILLGASGAVRSDAFADDWPTAGYSHARTGTNRVEATLGISNASNLRQAWSTSVDGAPITAQVIVASAVPTASGPRDLLFTGTEHGTFAALDAITGARVWSVNTGYAHTGCGDLPNGDFGIGATAEYDRPSNSVYAMGGDGRLYGYAADTGALRPGWPVTILPNPTIEHVYGGLSVVGGGVYVITASMCDYNSYHGRIMRVSSSQPHVTNVLYTDGTTTDANNQVVSYGPGGGGIWGPAGISVDLTTGYLYAATGNLIAQNEAAALGDHVLKMLPDLSIVGASPPPFACKNCDLDYGSTPIVFHPRGCGAIIAVINKSNNVYTYTTAPLSAQPQQILPNHEGVGDVAYDGHTQSLISANRDGMRAYTIGKDCKAALAWSQPGNSGPGGQLGQAVSPPAIANSVVYYANGAGSTLFAYNSVTGEPLWHAALGGYSFAQPTVVNGTVFVAAWDGSVRAYRP